MKKGVFIITLLIFLVSCDSPEQVHQTNQIIEQYNTHVAREKQIVTDHNNILEKLRFKMGDKFSYRTSIDEYLTFVGKYKTDLIVFKDFIVTHQAFLVQQSVDVDFVLKDVQNIIDTMDRNAKDFREWKINNPVTT